MRKLMMVFGLVLLLGLVISTVGSAEDVPVINPFKELVDWTFDQNIGATFLYDLDKKDYGAGARWNFFKSKHDWLYLGLDSRIRDINDEQAFQLGGAVFLNAGKAIEKIKGEPLVYLSHLEIGYFKNYDFSTKEWVDGVLLNVIKIKF